MNQHDLKEQVEEFFAYDSPEVIKRRQRLRNHVLESLGHFACAPQVHNSLAEPELALQFLNTALPDHPESFDSYVEFLDEVVLRHSINMASPYCLGHMTGTLPPLMPMLGEVVVALNQNLVKREASRVLTMIERQTLAMLHRLIFQRPESFYRQHTQTRDNALGVMTSCGTLANLTALWCARNACFPAHDGAPSVEEHGLTEVLRFHGYERAVIIGPSLMHYSIDKAAGILGLGARNVIKVPVDEHNCLSVAALEETVRFCERRRWRIIAIIAVAGTTECGTIDPLAAIAAVAARHRIHLHVDAAWGGPLLFSERHRGKLKGIELADSVTIDAHKQLYVPVGVSMLLLSDPQAAKAIEMQANYILRNGSGDLGKVSVEGSRPAASLFLHAALHLFGRAGYEFIIDSNIEKAQLMARLIVESPEFELLANPETNIVLYRYLPERWRTEASLRDGAPRDNDEINAFNSAVQQAQYEAGKTFVSRTTLSTLSVYPGTPIVCLRAVIANPLVQEHHLRTVLEDQARIALELDLAPVASGT